MRNLSSGAGFTLMEVLVALLVFSTAGLSLMMLNRDSVTGARVVEDRFLARTVANNQLTKVFIAETPLRLGVVTGEEAQMGRRFEWTQTISQSPRPDVVVIGVRVTRLGEDAPLAEAVSLKVRQ